MSELHKHYFNYKLVLSHVLSSVVRLHCSDELVLDRVIFCATLAACCVRLFSVMGARTSEKNTLQNYA